MPQRGDGGLSRVYASLPLTGPAGSLGREVLRGAELALDRSQDADVELITLDSSGEDRERLAAANARRASDDRRTLAYLGDFHSSQVVASAAVLGETDVLQVGELLVVRDHDAGYGIPVGAMCAEAARERGLAVRSRPV